MFELDVFDIDYGWVSFATKKIITRMRDRAAS